MNARIYAYLSSLYKKLNINKISEALKPAQRDLN